MVTFHESQGGSSFWWKGQLGVKHQKRRGMESGWWLSLPLWKIWVRQLGLWHSQYMESHKIHVPNHQPDIVWRIWTQLVGNILISRWILNCRGLILIVCQSANGQFPSNMWCCILNFIGQLRIDNACTLAFARVQFWLVQLWYKNHWPPGEATPPNS
jgi:hypothetical protein